MDVLEKIFGTSIGALLSTFLKVSLGLSSACLFSAVLGAFIGELVRGPSSRREVAISVAVASVIALFLGSMLVVHFPVYPAVAICFITALGLSVFRTAILQAARERILSLGKPRSQNKFDDYDSWGS